MTNPTTATKNFTPSSQKVTALLLMLVPLVFTVVFTLLGVTFEYPDILRKPVDYILERFLVGGSGLILLWYGMLVSALAFTAIPPFTRRLFAEKNLLLELGVIFGVLAGLVQALGFARWVFLVPFLAITNDQNSSQATQAAIAVVFEAFHRYLGMGIGEHLGYLFTALWTFSICFALRSGWLKITGLVFAGGILFGLLEPVGLGWAGLVNALAYLAWSLWLMAFGLQTWRNAAKMSNNE